MKAVSLQSIFALLVMGQTETTTVFEGLDTIMRLFEGERLSFHWHDIVFLGDFSPYKAQPDFTTHFQIAFHPEKANSTEDVNLICNILSSEPGKPVIFFYAPASVESLYDIVDTISMCGPTGNATEIEMNQRMNFLLWPTAQEPGIIQRELENDPNFLQSVQFISLVEHVYVLAWRLDAGQVVLTDTIEVYGIINAVAVVQSASKATTEDTFNNTFYIDTTELLRISLRRKDFHGMVFKAVGENDTYFQAEVTVKAFENGTIYFPSGSSFNILLDLMMILNFRHEPILGKGWTEREDNGTGIKGLAKQIAEYEADICISTTAMAPYLSDYVTFLQPVMVEESFTFFRQPSVTSARNIFMMPFDPVLWYSVFGLWLLMMICACILPLPKTPFLGHYGTGKMYSRCKPRQARFQWYDAYIWTAGVISQQGWFGSPTPVSLRILFITCLLGSLVIYAYYTAAFVAAISAPIVPVKSFSDLYRYEYEIFANPSNPGYIASFAGVRGAALCCLEIMGVTDEQQAAILAKSKKIFVSDEDAVAKIMTPNSKYATIIGLDGFYAVGLGAYNDEDLCKIDKLEGGEAATVKDAMLVRKGSPYKEMLGHVTVKLIERGLAHRYKITYEVSTELYCLPSPTQTLELTFLDCYTAFFILFTAHLLAFFLALLERHRRKFSSRLVS